MALTNDVTDIWVNQERNLQDDMAHIMAQYDEITPQLLAVVVATLCGISVADMMTEKRNHRVFARWLLYYSYRYATCASYEKISELFTYDGVRPSYSNVRNGILNFSQIIESNKYWCDKWNIIHNIIIGREKEQFVSKIPDKQVITINVPKELENKITIKIKTT